MSCCPSRGRCCPCPPAPSAPPSPRGEILFFASSTLAPESFTTVALPVLLPFDEVLTSLNPVSSPEFVMPLPGRLQYVGTVPREFDIHGQVTMTWVTEEGQAPQLPSVEFLVGLIVTPPGAASSILTGLFIAELFLPSEVGGGNVETFHTQRLYRLNPNDIVQIGLNASRPAGEAETMGVLAYSLIIS